MASACIGAGLPSLSRCENLSMSSSSLFSCSNSLRNLNSGIGIGNGEVVTLNSRRIGKARLLVCAGVIPLDAAGTNLSFAVASGGAIAALAGAVLLTDPQKRREKQAEAAGGNEKESVRNYFNTKGFERWRKIYGETDDVNGVQMDIRQGHAVTVEKTMALLRGGGGDGLRGVTVCDAGCGTGSLTVPMVLDGAIVSASDISSAMVEEASRQARLAISLRKEQAGDPIVTEPKFQAQDLESISGKYHTVVCLDVLIHYPQEKAADMIAHLASHSESRLVLSFAPKTPFYSFLKRVGELFPGPSKATRAYLHAEEDIERALRKVGWVVRSREMTATKFYFSTLLEAVPAKAAV